MAKKSNKVKYPKQVKDNAVSLEAVNCTAHAELKLVELDPAQDNRKAEEDFIIEGFASTEDLDRGFDVTHAEAFEKALDSFMLNPILLYMHNMSQPIGKIVSASIVKGKGLFVRAFISTDEAGIRSKIKEGILRAFSFGFHITKFDEEKPSAGQRIIRHIRGLELLEISVVSIPMNQRALFSLAKSIESAESGSDKATDIETVKKNDIYIMELEAKLNKFDVMQDQLDSLMERKADDADGGAGGDPLGLADIDGGFSAEHKEVVPFTDQGIVEDEAYVYDTGEEVRNADIKRLFDMSAWYDLKNSESKDGYKLPHHRESDGKAIWEGVSKRMGELLGLRGGVNIPEDDKKDVWNHLAKHYEQFSKDVPEYKDDYTVDELTNLVSIGSIKGEVDSETKSLDTSGNKSTSDISDDIRMALRKKHKVDDKNNKYVYVVDLYPVKFPNGHVIANVEDKTSDKYYQYDYVYKGEVVELSNEKELSREWTEKNLKDLETKAGRVISAKNKKKIQSAVEAIKACEDSLSGLLKADKEEVVEGDDDEKSALDVVVDKTSAEISDAELKELLASWKNDDEVSDAEIASLESELKELTNSIKEINS